MKYNVEEDKNLGVFAGGFSAMDPFACGLWLTRDSDGVSVAVPAQVYAAGMLWRTIKSLFTRRVAAIVVAEAPALVESPILERAVEVEAVQVAYEIADEVEKTYAA